MRILANDPTSSQARLPPSMEMVSFAPVSPSPVKSEASVSYAKDDDEDDDDSGVDTLNLPFITSIQLVPDTISDSSHIHSTGISLQSWPIFYIHPSLLKYLCRIPGKGCSCKLLPPEIQSDALETHLDHFAILTSSGG